MRFKICLEEIENTEEDLLVSNHEIELVEPYVEDHERMKSLDEAFESIALLEETISVIRQNPEGLNKAGLQLTDRTHSMVCRNMGINKTGSFYPSTESLKSYSARQRNTTIALENIKETVMRIFYAIKNAIKSVIDWFLNFFRSADHAYKTSLKKIKSLKDYLRSNRSELSDLPKGKYQNAIGISKLISHEKGGIDTGMRNLENFVDVTIKTMRDYTTNTLMASLKSVENTIFEKAEPRTSVFSIMDLPEIFVDSRIPGYLTPKGMQSFGTNIPLPGMKMPGVFHPDFANQPKLTYREGLNLHAQSNFFLGVSSEGLVTPQEVEFLNKDKLQLFLSTMENICEKYLFNTEAFKKITEGKSKLDKLITMYLDKESKKPKEEKNENLENKPTDEYDEYGFKQNDTPMFRFSYMIRCFNSYLDNVPVKMITNTAKLVQEALYYGIAFASDNINALKAK